jgi:SNF2 family DNA or RNA helicase
MHVYFPIVSNTIEERIMELCKHKDEMAESYLDGTHKSVSNSNIDKQTMADILNR